MKGDFSRAGFELHKGYSGVLMQQGRVQLDADWNEQAAITRHAIEARTRDLLGPAGAPEGGGFKLSARAAAAPAPEGSCELIISQGQFYVDGLLCENLTPGTAVLPFAARDGASAERTFALAYLDVWERHVTALEDARLREPALGGPDTATRTRTDWRVALLPVAPPAGETAPPAAERRPDWPAAWRGLLEGNGRRALMAAAVEANHQANQLYRVEVHDSGPAGPRVKWSRENGSVAFPVVGFAPLAGLPPAPARVAAEDRGAGDPGPSIEESRVVGEPGPLVFASEGSSGVAVAPPAAMEGSSGGAAAAPPTDEAPRAAAPSPAPGLFALQVLQLERDPHALVAGDTVEVEDPRPRPGEGPGLLAVVAEVALLPGTGPHLGELVAHLTLRAEPAAIAALGERLGGPASATAPGPIGLVLRRWDRPADSLRPDPAAQPSLIAVREGATHRLDPGVTVSFTNLAALRPGDYWQFSARAEQAGQRWAERPPDGPTHHYAPLALLAQDASSWSVLEDLRPRFQSTPALTAALAVERRRLDEAATTVGQLHATVEQLQATLALQSAELAALRLRVAEVRGRLEDEYIADEAIEAGAVVAAHPGSAERIEPAGEANASLLIGVVALVDDRPDVGSPIYRVVTRGRVSCWVKGAVQPGDLLVVSEAPGVARRAGFYVRPGTLLGKALTGAQADDEGGSMRVDVMVTLG